MTWRFNKWTNKVQFDGDAVTEVIDPALGEALAMAARCHAALADAVTAMALVDKTDPASVEAAQELAKRAIEKVQEKV